MIREYETLIFKESRSMRNFCNCFSSIYIYGAGSIGKKIIKHIEDMKINISGIIVSDGYAVQSKINNYDVYEISKVLLNEQDGIILAMSIDNQQIVMKILSRKGIPKRNIYQQNTYGRRIKREEFYNKCHYLMQSKYQASTFFDNYNELELLGRKFGTDKSSKFHNYLCKYEIFLKSWKNQEFNLIELGVLNGESLYMWSDYFPKAHIWGVDINPDCKQYEVNNIHIIILDLDEINNNLSLLDKLNGRPSIIIDDASHLWSHQIKSLFTLFPALNRGGVYIIEDLETSFHFGKDLGYDDSSVSTYEICSAIAEVITSNEYLSEAKRSFAIMCLSGYIEKIAVEIDMISFITGSCIMVKK